MNDLIVFSVQIGLPLLLGIAATGYLRDVTRDLLTEICGTARRAEFWVRVTAILTIATPVILVLLWGYTAPVTADYGVVRQTLWLSLAGIVGAVAVLARTIWQQIPHDTEIPRPNHEAEDVPCAS